MEETTKIRFPRENFIIPIDINDNWPETELKKIRPLSILRTKSRLNRPYKHLMKKLKVMNDNLIIISTASTNADFFKTFKKVQRRFNANDFKYNLAELSGSKLKSFEKSLKDVWNNFNYIITTAIAAIYKKSHDLLRKFVFDPSETIGILNINTEDLKTLLNLSNFFGFVLNEPKVGKLMNKQNDIRIKRIIYLVNAGQTYNSVYYHNLITQIINKIRNQQKPQKLEEVKKITATETQEMDDDFYGDTGEGAGGDISDIEELTKEEEEEKEEEEKEKEKETPESQTARFLEEDKDIITQLEKAKIMIIKSSLPEYAKSGHQKLLEAMISFIPSQLPSSSSSGLRTSLTKKTSMKDEIVGTFL